jgi:hypothetical protein
LADGIGPDDEDNADHGDNGSDADDRGENWANDPDRNPAELIKEASFALG